MFNQTGRKTKSEMTDTQKALLDCQRELVTVSVQMKRARTASQLDVVAQLQPKYEELKKRIGELERAGKAKSDKAGEQKNS